MQDRARTEARFSDPLCQKQMPKQKKRNLWNRTGGYSRLCMGKAWRLDVTAVQGRERETCASAGGG